MIDARLSKWGARRINLAMFILWSIVLSVDFSTGPQLSFTIFYLVPIAISAWYIGWGDGLFNAVFGTVAWFIGDIVNGMAWTSQGVRFWNTGVRGSVFILVAYAIAMLHHRLDLERALARTDPLTGVSNWRHFSELASREIWRAQRYHMPITLAYFDVDNFKNINDRAGHEAGNKVLLEIATTLSSTFRGTDVVARIGGDEFVVLLPEQDQARAEFAVKKARQQLLAVAKKYNNAIGFSIGVVTATAAPERIETLVEAADSLMYEVKAEGRSGLRFAIYDADHAAPPGVPRVHG